MNTVDLIASGIQPFQMPEFDSFNPVTTDYAGTSDQDYVRNGGLVQTLDNNIATKFIVAQNADTTKISIPANKKLSIGLSILTKNIDDTILSFKISGSVISASQSVNVSAHAGYSDNAAGYIHRSWSFGNFGAQTLSHADSVLFNDSAAKTYLLFWLTVANFSSSAQNCYASFSASLWSSGFLRPYIRDVNAA